MGKKTFQQTQKSNFFFFFKNYLKNKKMKIKRKKCDLKFGNKGKFLFLLSKVSNTVEIKTFSKFEETGQAIKKRIGQNSTTNEFDYTKQGTEIKIEGIFQKIPVRTKNFDKNKEKSKIFKLIESISISFPEIHFCLAQTDFEEKINFASPFCEKEIVLIDLSVCGDSQERFYQIFGNLNCFNEPIVFENKNFGVKVKNFFFFFLFIFYFLFLFFIFLFFILL